MLMSHVKADAPLPSPAVVTGLGLAKMVFLFTSFHRSMAQNLFFLCLLLFPTKAKMVVVAVRFNFFVVSRDVSREVITVLLGL